MIEFDLQNVVPALRAGSVIAYPTEAVWGLGCDPANETAVMKLLALKQRPVEKGMILVAADVTQLQGWVRLDALAEDRRQAVLDSWPGANTWIVPAGPLAPRWITGEHTGIAVRVSSCGIPGRGVPGTRGCLRACPRWRTSARTARFRTPALPRCRIRRRY